jgi:sec-independent protein translocase protein TatB
MFDIFSGQHILILLAVLLIVVGPKDLPRLMRIMGQWAGKARAMANEFKKSFDDMARQEELDKLRQELEALRQTNMTVSEDAQRVAEADLPAEHPAGGEPRAGEYQIKAAPAEAAVQAPASPEGAPPPAAAAGSPAP